MNRVVPSPWLAIGGSALFLIAIQSAGAFPRTSESRSLLRALQDHNIPYSDERISLMSFEPMDAVQMIQFLATRGDIQNLVIGSDVQGMSVRFRFDDVPGVEALDTLLAINQLAFTIHGGMINIMTDARYRSIFGRSFYDNRNVRVVPIDGDHSPLLDVLAPIKSQNGFVVFDSVSGSLALIDSPERLDIMESIIQQANLARSQALDTETKEFRLQYADVATVQTEVGRLLSEQAGFMHADARTRTLRVTDVPHIIRRVEDMVTLYDRRHRQVFIEAKIVQVSLTDKFTFGVNWNHFFSGLDPRFDIGTAVRPDIIQFDPGGTTLTRAAEVATGGLGISYNTITAGGSLSAVLQALQSVGETKLLSNPHIAVLDGDQAQIRVITDEPYSEAQLESGSTNVVGETFKFIEVGVTLDVTPRISDDSMISMSIRPEVSSVIDRYKGAVQTRDGVPIVRKSYAETSVMIKDGETIIIAGMIENEKRESEARVPFLGRIPLLGVLFRTQQEESNNRELIVFLTPRIISGERPFLRMEDAKKRPRPMRRVGTVDDEVKELRPLR